MAGCKVTELEIKITEEEFIALLKQGGYIPEGLNLEPDFVVEIENASSDGEDPIKITIDWDYHKR